MTELAISTTEHTTKYMDAVTGLKELDDESVNLTVTSPPYPMIEMWDDMFANCSPKIQSAIENEEWAVAHNEMHAYLNTIWKEVIRVTAENCVIAVNIGNATRRTNDSFSLFPNTSPIIEYFTENGCEMLPSIHWHKASNKSASFMGSGTIPTNAYVTNDHEYILLFRKGTGTRDFPPKHTKRYQSGFFWEERNEWFSDRWTFTGENQSLENGGRDRSAAYPIELPYRIISMYSIYDDTVLDPFLGTGTTQLAATALGRNSLGFELDASLQDELKQNLTTITDWSSTKANTRITAHKEFVENSSYDFPYDSPYGTVKTTYETDMLLSETVRTTIVEQTNEVLEWTAEHTATNS